MQAHMYVCVCVTEIIHFVRIINSFSILHTEREVQVRKDGGAGGASVPV